MTTAFRLRRALVATLIVTAIWTAFPVPQASAATTKATRYTYVSKKICPIDWRQGPYYVKQLIRCSAHHYGVSATKALAIARRESGFNPKAYNSSSCAEGLFQHLCNYWPGRAYTYGFKGWSAYNGRANAFVTMRMVKKHGWGAWGG